METANPGLALSEDHFTADRSASVDGSVRIVMIIGFLAVLALEAYLIWEGLSLL